MKENPEFLKRLTKVSKLIKAQKILPSAVRTPVKRSKNLINTNFFRVLFQYFIDISVLITYYLIL